ncbi:Zn-ribbon domain-containing OB-fold protein [Rhodovulum sulfidophilum]|uniref:Zn-ribbon domain-containing OB-fold protein n=1 Tax=Rhodovulum sulfidophilum TaxID=35806 RepID=UPI001F3CAABF|nr:zinc ribbon domain-containing protein [Rhodovulum sulfidophilum]MCE8439165.1 zinc ribbon domain-containing protein [Rhodovulum sulfidophilum]
MTDLSTLKVPGPTVIALTAPFWEAAAEGRLVIQRCGACGDAVFYPREICPHCWADALSWEEASGAGRLKTFSTIWKPGHPGWIPAAPYVVGLVELAEGPTMLSHILGKAPEIGMDLTLAPTNTGGRVLPCFRPKRG